MPARLSDEIEHPPEEVAWEWFHENSKTNRFEPLLPERTLVEKMQSGHGALPFYGFARIALPTTLRPLRQSLDQVIKSRATARKLTPASLTVTDLATLLHYSYGISRDNTDEGFPCPFRMVPSGGALYPLEIFFHSMRIEGLAGGLYHYNPLLHALHHIRDGDQREAIANGLVQSELAQQASVIFFVAAMFERSVFKYGDRGYRFTLIEAGHWAQNLDLVACSLGYQSVNIGGFFDHVLDPLFDLDGLNQSIIYAAALGNAG